MTVHGQHEGRAERNRNTRDWLGAQSQTADGRPVTDHIETQEADYNIVVAIVEQIRFAIASGQRVRVGERHQPTVEAIAAMLTPEEHPWVIWDLDNVMPPERAELTEKQSSPPVAANVRDVVRSKNSRVLSIENGGVTPLS